jgi:arylsulfatase A-like enzyme
MNVILIHTDQQRFDSLGCMGNRFAQTPNLDRLASEGQCFTRHFAGNTVCMPSRASLLTGTYPSYHGVVANGIPLPRHDPRMIGPQLAQNRRAQQVLSHVPTLADLLKEEGYNTAAVGKLHLTPSQAHADSGCQESHELWETGKFDNWHGPYYGFDHVDMSLHHGERVFAHYANWLKQQYPEEFERIHVRRERPAPPLATVPGDVYPSPVPEAAHHSTWVGDRAVEYIERQSQDAPFFLWVGFPDPHHPWTPPQEVWERFVGKGAEESTFGKETNFTNSMSRREVYPQNAPGDLDEDGIRLIREATNAQIHLIDRNVGRILKRIEEKGIADDTLIIFTSDHGDYLGDYGRIRKDSYACRALSNVSFIVKIPGRTIPISDNSASDNTCIVPTTLEALNIEAPEHIQGRSLFANSPESPGPLPMTQSLGPVNSTHRNISIWDDRHRLTYFPGTGEVELFDHADDPYELKNLSDDPAYGQRRDELYRKLLKQTVDMTHPHIGRISTW